MSGSFIQELKRRNVFRVAAIYVIVSWLLMQIGDVMFPALRLPEWTTTMLVAFLLLGLPIALVLSWAYEATPDGIKRTSDVGPGESITDLTGRKINYIIIAVLAVAVVFLLGKDLLRDDPSPSTAASVSNKSIAVLPFANRSAAEENAEFFAAGVHDELLTLLSKLGDLKVISRTSVENLEDGLSIPEIGSLLGVATVLEGQVQRAGDTLRINVQLINTAQEDHLWATTYDRELTAGNVFQVQSEIARTIADSLHAELSESDVALLNIVPTENTEALRLYMLGRQLMGRSSFESMQQSARYFKEAATLDPGYAEAWAAIASLHSTMLQTGLIGVDEYIAIAEPAIARALQLNDWLAEAHAQQGTLNWRSGDLDAAEASFERALDINPNDSKSLRVYGNYLRTTGRPQQAIPILERALEGDPLSALILFDVGKAEMYVGHPERTVQYAQRILEADPSSVYGYTGTLQARLWMGQIALAWPWYIKVIAADPDDFETGAHLGLLSESLGAPDWAERYLDFARALGPNEPVVLKCDVQIFTQRNQYDKALTVARQALEAGLDNRWGSDQIFLRVVRDDALRTEHYVDALAWYQNRHPELFGDSPVVNIVNVNTAADLALLLRHAGEPDTADALIDAALYWYRDNHVPGVYGSLAGIVDVELLALKSDKKAALVALRDAVDYGWRIDVKWPLNGENLSSLRDDAEFQAIVAEIENDLATQLEAIKALPNMGEFDLR
jgi:TolB-like protein/Flp pilus assembly protein TadD